MELIIGLLSGAIGGNVSGKLLDRIDQGAFINSVAGVAGGGVGAMILTQLGAGGAYGLDLAGLAAQVASGGLGGGVVLAVVSMVRGALSR